MATAASALRSAQARSAHVYLIEPFAFDSLSGELFRAGALVKLVPKASQVLAYLLHNPGRIISRQELLAQIWPDIRVTEGSLTQAVWEIRGALDDRGSSQRFIETRYGLGYRLVVHPEVVKSTRGSLSQASLSRVVMT